MSLRKVVIKNGKTKWEVRFHLSGRGSPRVKKCFSTKAEAEAHLQSYKIEKSGTRTHQGTSKESDTTFREEAEHWLSVQQLSFSEAHRQNVTRFLEKLLPKYGEFAPERFSPSLLRSIRNELLENELRPSTVNRHIQVIQTVLNFAVQDERISQNPAFGFKKLKEVRDSLGFWELSEAQGFLGFAEKKYPR